VVMQSHASEEQVRAVCQRIESLGLKAHPIPERFVRRWHHRNKGASTWAWLEITAGRGGMIPVSKPYQIGEPGRERGR